MQHVNENRTVEPYAWVILGVVFLASLTGPLNQFKVPPLMPVLMETFNMSLSQAGMLMSLFAVVGLILALPSGFVIQKLGPKLAGLIAVGCLVAGSTMGVVSTNIELLLASRVIEGAGMGLIAVTAPAAIAMWFPREKQGVAMGIWALWVPIGGLIMYNLAPVMNESMGWQSAWWLGTGFSVVAFVLYAILMRLPATITTAEATGADNPGTVHPPLREGLANRDVWLLALLFACFVFALNNIATFLPTFLATEHGYSLSRAAFISSIPSFVIMVSSPLAGWISDRIGSRKLVYTVPHVIVAVMLLVPFHLSGWQYPVYLVLIGILAGAIPTAIFASIPEAVTKPQLLGMGMAVLMVGQNLGLFIGPMVFTNLVEVFNWAIAGYLLIPVCAIGIIAGLAVKVR